MTPLTRRRKGKRPFVTTQQSLLPVPAVPWAGPSGPCPQRRPSSADRSMHADHPRLQYPNASGRAARPPPPRRQRRGTNPPPCRASRSAMSTCPVGGGPIATEYGSRRSDRGKIWRRSSTPAPPPRPGAGPTAWPCTRAARRSPTVSWRTPRRSTRPPNASPPPRRRSWGPKRRRPSDCRAFTPAWNWSWSESRPTRSGVPLLMA
mmetsp:Transcript_29019/g.68023  ORF Transcript_29019/g.68023 Transcript_29019/m.68023 type:complete len:205 (+) Transcript_29019:673-1287(+)